MKQLWHDAESNSYYNVIEKCQKPLSEVEFFIKKWITRSSANSSLSTTFSEVIANSRFCCFNQNSDIKAIENKLMWGHYGNGFRGMILEFYADNLVTSLNIKNNQKLQYGEMDYSGLTTTDPLVQLSNSRPSTNSNNNLSSILLKKCKEWEYENELRFISDNTQKMIYSHDCIKSITIGQRMLKPNRKELLKVVNSLGLTSKCQVATVCKETFNIKIEPYDERFFSGD